MHHLLCMHAKSLQSCLTLCDPMDYCGPPSSSCPWDSPSNNTGVGCHALLQGIFPTQGLGPHLQAPPALAGGFFTTSAASEAVIVSYVPRIISEEQISNTVYCTMTTRKTQMQIKRVQFSHILGLHFLIVRLLLQCIFRLWETNPLFLCYEEAPQTKFVLL